jgi:hypothetical protein
VAIEFARYGLGSDARPEPAFDPDTLWRIPDINVAPITPLIRELRPEDIIVLNNRRAGKRGRSKPKTKQFIAAT